MRRAAEDQEQTQQHGAQTRAEPIVVVTSSLPERETVLQEVIVALATGPLEDVGNEVQARGAGIGFLDGGVDFALRGTLVHVHALVGLGLGLILGVIGDEGAADLVRVQVLGLFAVGLDDLLLVGIGANLEEVCGSADGLGWFSIRWPSYAAGGTQCDCHCSRGLRTVKSHIGTFGCSQLIAEAEDLVVWK